ncbi:MAG: hypothetical protein FWH49_07165 [Clostridiales bacterium]|nr:hypothetical protein [Clostridiales bacterium]
MQFPRITNVIAQMQDASGFVSLAASDIRSVLPWESEITNSLIAHTLALNRYIGHIRFRPLV